MKTVRDGDRDGSSGTVLLLDACAVINLYASRRMKEILVGFGGRFEIYENVIKEARHVRDVDAISGIFTMIEIDLEPLLAQKIVHLASLASESELETYIDLLLGGLGDGESMSGAIAHHRGMTVVTDDRVAARMLEEIDISTIPALQPVRHWTEQMEQRHEVVQTTLEDIRFRGRYVPARSHPLREWWDAFLSP